MAIRWQDYIEERKDVMMGKPVFTGTRLTVDHILTEMGSGMTVAAMLYAAAVVSMDETVYA